MINEYIDDKFITKWHLNNAILHHSIVWCCFQTISILTSRVYKLRNKQFRINIRSKFFFKADSGNTLSYDVPAYTSAACTGVAVDFTNKNIKNIKRWLDLFIKSSHLLIFFFQNSEVKNQKLVLTYKISNKPV